MNYKAAVYPRHKSWDQFSIDKNYKNFLFLKKIIEKENCHQFLYDFFSMPEYSCSKNKNWPYDITEWMMRTMHHMFTSWF